MYSVTNSQILLSKIGRLPSVQKRCKLSPSMSSLETASLAATAEELDLPAPVLLHLSEQAGRYR